MMDYDAELRLQNEALRRACAIGRDEIVVDIGCGTGQTTREAARAASAGSALGIDTSAPMIARARELARNEGLANARFETGDAQTWSFSPQSFDIAISRFGTMFFRDPLTAFVNIRGALKAGGRLVMIVWQSHAANEWSIAIQQCLAAEARSPVTATDALDPFSLADPRAVERLLAAAGFAGTTLREVHEPVYYGDSVESAFEWIGGFLGTREILQGLDVRDAERARERLRETLAKHRRVDGVWFDSRAWLITAHRP
ncbi:MAG TPA: methyltransferase domain-containing protein [Steroidobacteraceae bacterium]|jgi:ubiquinone/menaquinone biosynthesis C-methylase UbiE